MSRNILIVALILFFLIPFFYLGWVFALIFWDGFRYNKFQDSLIQKYEDSGHDLLQVSVCHEWKCIFEFKDERSRYKFLIFGEEELEQRFQKMIDLSENLDRVPEGCRYIQQGSNLCQL